MNNPVRVCFLAFSILVLVISCSSSPVLTEESVNGFISEIEDATANFNAGQISRALSDDATITLNISMQGSTQVMKPSKQEYIIMLKQGWSEAENYKFSKSNVTINIQGSKAFVSSDGTETMTIRGKNMTGKTKEKVTIEVVDGKLLITNVVAHITMYFT